MKKRIRLIFASALLLASPAFADPNNPSSKTFTGPVIVARVNGAALTSRDLQDELERLFPFYQIHGARVPAQLEPEIRKKALNRIVLEELLFQEAKRRHFQIPPQALENRIKQARQQFKSDTDFERALVKRYGSKDEFHQRTKRALLIETLWEQEVIEQSQPRETEMRSYYRENRSKFTRPESVWLQTISFQASETDSPENRRKAKKAALETLAKAKASNSYQAFGELAEKISTDDWRVMNGDHGWVHRGALDSELEVAFRMNPNEISGVIASHQGFHILRSNGHRPEVLMPYAKVKMGIKKSLLEQHAQMKGKQLEEILRSKAQVEILVTEKP